MTSMIFAKSILFIELYCLECVYNTRMKTECVWQNIRLSLKDRSKIKNQKPQCVWITGLPCSGKSTIANALEEHLYNLGKHTYLLDGDNLRHSLNNDLDFSIKARHENIRRTAEVARLMVDAGLIVIVAIISPLHKDREFARSKFSDNQFKEVYLSTPLAVCEKRDVKNMYKKARTGIMKNFTGIDSPYEVPECPDIAIDTQSLTVNEVVSRIKNIIE